MITVGCKVVCIDDSFPIQILDWTNCWPRRGRVYTVRALSRQPHGVTGVWGPGVKLEEIDSGIVSFCLWRFREITTFATSEETATALEGLSQHPEQTTSRPLP